MDKNFLLYEGTEKLPEIFNKEDIKKLQEAIINSNDYLPNIHGEFMKKRDLSLLMTIYLLALRPREACKLRFDDFNLKKLTVKIRGVNNKEGKDRELPIPLELFRYYKGYFKFNRARFWKLSPYIFPSFENPFISPERWKSIFREKVLKPAGLWIAPEGISHTPKYRSYTLRHTRATEILNKSNDIFLVSNILGHSKLSSSKVYLHKTDSYIDYVRKMLEK